MSVCVLIIYCAVGRLLIIYVLVIYCAVGRLLIVITYAYSNVVSW